jgi:phage/plasmid-associated DNA primase
VPTLQLWEDWHTYCKSAGSYPGDLVSFNSDLQKHGFKYEPQKRVDGKRKAGFYGIKLNPDSQKVVVADGDSPF